MTDGINSEISIEEIQEAIRNIDSRKLTVLIADFLKISAQVDNALYLNGSLPEKTIHRYENAYTEVIRESAAVLSKSGISAVRIINYRFRMNGLSKGIPEIDSLTASWFRKIRKHQMELLSTINDEVGIIRDSIRQYKKMQEVMRKHCPAISKAGNMMGVIRERITRRPTTLLRLAGREEKITELNETFQDMNDYENLQQFRLESGSHPEKDAFQLYQELGQGTLGEILLRQEKVKNAVKELQKGRKLLVKLVSKGYSPFMKKSLDALNAKHEERSRNFLSSVEENRLLYYLRPSPFSAAG
ncbi:MAG: hypothetical protein V2I97_24205 [Desulfococcaceae bacterium]|jgi:hypothetical protein|nr:hypothetical protein [Desulfococcaceae bacterium]